MKMSPGQFNVTKKSLKRIDEMIEKNKPKS